MTRDQQPADIKRVNVGGSAVMVIPNPQSYADGGVVWQLTYGDSNSVRLIAASLITSYDYLISPLIPVSEAIRRLRMLRAAYRESIQDTTP